MSTNFFSEALRAKKIILKNVSRLEIDLSQRTVLTEVGSNQFIFTPLIAYFSGASKILVWVSDSKYGYANQIKKIFFTLLSSLRIDSSRFEFSLNAKNDNHIRQADIVTNLRAIRPIDEAFIGKLKNTAVISYMCEAWEARPGDVDIEYCKQRKIKIGGVWENHPDLMIFDGCGALSIKLAHEAGFEVYQNNILVVSSDKFGTVASAAFRNLGAAVQLTAPENINKYRLTDYDFIFVADYTYPDEIIGSSFIQSLPETNLVSIVHLCGSVNVPLLVEKGIKCYPAETGHSFKMTRTLGHLGIKPVLDLYSAGFKVGECLYKNIPSDLIQAL